MPGSIAGTGSCRRGQRRLAPRRGTAIIAPMADTFRIGVIGLQHDHLCVPQRRAAHPGRPVQVHAIRPGHYGPPGWPEHPDRHPGRCTAIGGIRGTLRIWAVVATLVMEFTLVSFSVPRVRPLDRPPAAARVPARPAPRAPRHAGVRVRSAGARRRTLPAGFEPPRLDRCPRLQLARGPRLRRPGTALAADLVHDEGLRHRVRGPDDIAVLPGPTGPSPGPTATASGRWCSPRATRSGGTR